MKGHKKLFIAVLTALAMLLAFVVVSCVTKIIGDGDRSVFSGSNEPIYVTNTGSSTISVIDLANLKVNRTIDLRDEAPGNTSRQGHFIGVTPDGNYLMVSEALGTTEGKVLFIDTRTDEVVKRFNVGAGIGLHLSRDGKWLFTISNGKGTVDGVSYDNVINIFDVEKQEYLGKIDHGSVPHVLDISWDGKTLYTTNHGGGKLVAYDITGLPSRLPTTPSWTFDVYQNLKNSGAIAASVTGVTLHALVVHPNDKYVIVGSFDNPLLTGGGDIIVDVVNNRIVARIPGRPHNYDISPDQRYLLSGESNSPDCEESAYLHDHGHTGLEGPLVRIIDISELSSARPDFSKISVVHNIDSGALGGTGGINHQSYDRSGKYIIVAASGKDGSDGHVLIVDVLNNYKLIANLRVNLAPHGIVYPGYGR